MRGAALVLLALLTRAPNPHLTSAYTGKQKHPSVGILVAITVQADKDTRFCQHDYNGSIEQRSKEKYGRFSQATFHNVLLCAEALKVKILFIQFACTEQQCVCEFENWQALNNPLRSQHVKVIMRLQMVFHFTRCVCLNYLHVYPILIRVVGRINLKFTTLLHMLKHHYGHWENIMQTTSKLNIQTDKTEKCMYYTSISMNEAWWINSTISLWPMRKGRKLSKLLYRKESTFIKNVWEDMFFHGLPASACAPAAQLYGLTQSHAQHISGSMYAMVKETRGNCAFTCALYYTGFLKYKKCLCLLSCLPRKLTDENKITEGCVNTTWPAFKRWQKVTTQNILHLPKSFWTAVIKGLVQTGIMGLLLLAMSLYLLCYTAAMISISYQQRHPISHRANNSKLSFLLLLAISLCSPCPFTLTVEPSGCSCKVQHTVFGITFVLCISCVLGNTIVVLMAFRATLSCKIIEWVGQKLCVLAIILFQVFICFLWLIDVPSLNININQEQIYLESDSGCALDRLRHIAALSLFLAFVAKKKTFTVALYLYLNNLIFIGIIVCTLFINVGAQQCVFGK